MNKNAVILFTNSPYADAVAKTHSSNPSIIKLAENCFQESILNLVQKISCNKYTLLVSSSDKLLFDYLKIKKGNSIQQKSNSFGERFYNSISTAFKKGYKRVTIIGNDTTIIRKRALLKSLKQPGNTTCLGPSSNGGFYLLSIAAKDFEKINKLDFISLPYQTNKVFFELTSLLFKNAIKTKLLKKKQYFDCSNNLLVIQQFKKVLLFIRFQLIKSRLLLLANNFIADILIVTHTSAFKLSFHKAPPLG